MQIEIRGLEELREAVARNPEVTMRAVNNFLRQGIAVYQKIILNNPWRVGMSGGGAPVRIKNSKSLYPKGNLRDTHQVDTSRAFEARIFPTAPYAKYVHDGTGRMRERPWLDYAERTGQRDVEKLADEMVGTIVESLAK